MRYDEPILIMGPSRSGTTILNRILRNHPEVYQTMEALEYSPTCFDKFREFVDNAIAIDVVEGDFEGGTWEQGKLSLTVYNKERQARIIKRLRERIDEIKTHEDLPIFWDAVIEGETKYGDKRPEYIHETGFIHKVYPKAKYLVTIRDPRDIWCSQVRHYHNKKRKGEEPHFWMEECLEAAMYSNPRAGQGMNAIERMATWLNTRDNLNYLEVYYEDMCQKPDETLEKIATFCDISILGLEQTYDTFFTPTNFGVWKEVWKEQPRNPDMYITDYYWYIMERFGYYHD